MAHKAKRTAGGIGIETTSTANWEGVFGIGPQNCSACLEYGVKTGNVIGPAAVDFGFRAQTVWGGVQGSTYQISIGKFEGVWWSTYNGPTGGQEFRGYKAFRLVYNAPTPIGIPTQQWLSWVGGPTVTPNTWYVLRLIPHVNGLEAYVFINNMWGYYMFDPWFPGAPSRYQIDGAYTSVFMSIRNWNFNTNTPYYGTEENPDNCFIECTDFYSRIYPYEDRLELPPFPPSTAFPFLPYGGVHGYV